MSTMPEVLKVMKLIEEENYSDAKDLVLSAKIEIEEFSELDKRTQAVIGCWIHMALPAAERI